MFAAVVSRFSYTVVYLQHQIEDYCKSVNMKINLNKTKIIDFRNGSVSKQT
jgi:phage host-nuclease inhibitor protein Gam